MEVLLKGDGNILTTLLPAVDIDSKFHRCSGRDHLDIKVQPLELLPQRIGIFFEFCEGLVDCALDLAEWANSSVGFANWWDGLFTLEEV